MTGPRWSIWLTLGTEHEALLSDCIRRLATKYQAPFFRPHCTVYSPITKDPGSAFNTICTELSDIHPFKGKMSLVLYSNVIWKTIFIELIQSPELEFINRTLERIFTGSYEFKPHISLIYKEISTKQKQGIISNLNLINEYHFNAIEVVKTGTSVEKWETVHRMELE